MVRDPHEEGAELRVLVVDDHIDAATSLTTLLQLLGCRAALAFGGSMALRVARLFRPDVVILDLDMPGLDGCEVLQEMRELEETPTHTLYVCLTGRSEPEDRRRCEAAGFHRFFSKPLDPDELAALIEEGRLRANRQRAAAQPGEGPAERP